MANFHNDFQLSSSRLQIARCNAIINRDNVEYHSTVIDNSLDPKKLCH